MGTRTGRAAESLLAQLNAGQIEYVGLEQSQMLLSARQRLASARARLSLWNADTLATHAHSADIIWLNNALHRLLPEDPAPCDITTACRSRRAALRDGVSPVNAVRPAQHAPVNQWAAGGLAA
ncbi:class I SAM-dependent methyltransferase [Salmonella enterica subsp. enterica serovar Senftenberg]|nr:class I SAM-dependent methyltransferase [Salmonella enterica subsp. enterica serovar Senftenberg]